MSYYPDGCVYIATDHWDGAKDYLEQNFSDVDEPRITLDRYGNICWNLSNAVQILLVLLCEFHLFRL